MIKHHLKEYTNEELAEVLAKVVQEQHSRRAADTCRDNELMAKREAVSVADQICFGYTAHVEGMKIQREYSEHYSDLINNMETKKPMKALLILERSAGSTHWVGGDAHIEVESATKAMVTALDWMEDNNMPRSMLRYIFVDGMLFEYTSKPVLADVMTGIEI